MPYTFEYKDLPIGIAETSAREGETVQVRRREVLTSDDGVMLTRRLEKVVTPILALSSNAEEIRPEIVHQLLAIIAPDRIVTVYVNELAQVLEVIPKKDLIGGQAVTTDHIADVKRLHFAGVDIPKDAGVIVVLSNGWRKALFYDFGPFLPGMSGREYEIDIHLGQIYAYLGFQHFFSLDEEEWASLFEQGWFLFLALNQSTLERIVDHVKNGWPVDDLLDNIVEDVKALIPSFGVKWQNHKIFADHAAFLNRALERYQSGDYISATHILYSQIEGIIRTHVSKTIPSLMPSLNSPKMALAVTDSVGPERHQQSLLLPNRFESFLRKVYFANFDPTTSRTTQAINRNTVAHGVADSGKFDLKAATIGFLILEQLLFYTN